MARPKEFDRDTALTQAIQVFTDHGFEGSSTSALLQAMGISRQSLYDTFGDKRALYLEALRYYTASSVSSMIGALRSGSSPLDGLIAMLNGLAIQSPPGGVHGCLAVSAVCEFGRSDAAVTQLNDGSSAVLAAALEKQIMAAKAAGEIATSLDPGEVARFLLVTLTGMKVALRDGASEDDLRNIVNMAIRGLR